MANMTFKASLLPNSDLGYSLGSNTTGNIKRWNFYGNLTGNVTGNADTATKATQDQNGYNINDCYKKNYIQVIDLTSSTYNINTWYPVVTALPGNGLHLIGCVVQLDSGSKPSWCTHNGGFTAVVELLANAGGWRTTGAQTVCLINDQRHIATNESPPVGYNQYNNSSSATFFCRGGGKYRLLTDWFATWTVYTSNTTLSSQTIGPTTTYPGITHVYTTLQANIAGNATTATSADSINLYEARASTSTLNKFANYVGAGKMFHLIASSSTSTTDNGKPPMGDANILQMNWDNNGGFDGQLAISTGSNRMEFRDQPSTKKAWREVVTSTPGTAAGGDAQPVYISNTGVATACTTANLKAGKDSDGNTINSTYLKLSGGTMTGPLQWTATALPKTTSAEYFVAIDAFASGGTTKWINKADTITSLDSNHKWIRVAGDTMTGVLSITSTTPASSTSTGALKVSGGIGCAGDIYAAAFKGNADSATNITQTADNTEGELFLLYTDASATTTTGVKFNSNIKINPSKRSMGLGAATPSGYASYARGAQVSGSDPNNIASGSASTAIGLRTTASGSYSIAYGQDALASGNFSIATCNGQATAKQSVAIGPYTVASQEREFVIGAANVQSTSKLYAFVVGNGTSTSNRSNAFTVGWDGSINAATAVKISDKVSLQFNTTTNALDFVFT